MKFINRLGFIFLAILSIQTITYFAIGKTLLIQEIGTNYESSALDIEANVIHNLGIFSELQPTKKQIQDNFELVSSFNYTICKTESEFRDTRTKEHYFLYYFNNTTRNPFSINLIDEYEGGYEYGASWESKYIWLFYKWVLLEKYSTGMS